MIWLLVFSMVLIGVILTFIFSVFYVNHLNKNHNSELDELRESFKTSLVKHFDMTYSEFMNFCDAYMLLNSVLDIDNHIVVEKCDGSVNSSLSIEDLPVSLFSNKDIKKLTASYYGRYIYFKQDGDYLIYNTSPEIIYDDSAYVDVKKPVIYINGETDGQEMSVSIDTENEIICEYTKRVNNVWEVKADKNGLLVDKEGQTYNYLYWEGKSKSEYDFSKGFCVKGEDSA